MNKKFILPLFSCLLLLTACPSQNVTLTGTLEILANGPMEIIKSNTINPLYVEIGGQKTTDVTWTTVGGAASIDEKGNLKGNFVGKSRVVATYVKNPSISNEIDVEVVNTIIAPTRITLSTDSGFDYFYTGEQLKVNAEMFPDNCTPEVIFSSLDPQTISTTRNGLLTGHKIGSTTIYATAAHNPSLRVQMNVSYIESIAGETISITNKSSKIFKGVPSKMNVDITSKLDLNRVRYESSNPYLCPINANGEFTAQSDMGEVTLTAYYNIDNKIRDSFTAVLAGSTIQPNTFEVLSVSDYELIVNDTIKLYGEGKPDNASFDANWVSSNPSVATVDSSGLVKALLPGTVTISATSRLNPLLNDSVQIVVKNGEGFRRVSEYGDYRLSDLKNAKNLNVVNPLGERKLLVVPIQISDAPKWNDKMLEELNRAFFGQSIETGWESVSSFYEKSSHGNLRLSGEIAPIVELNRTMSDMNTLANNSYQGQITYTAERVYSTLSQELLSEYDLDNDNFVDGIYFVYTNPPSGGAFWAQVWWFPNNVTYGNDFNRPTGGNTGLRTHMWASFQFLNDQYEDGLPDTHTFIHETGHILGLDDYYDYAGNSSPVGGVDMMDHTICDHNPYSKMAMEWVKPYYVDGSKAETVITINSFTETGEFIIVNDTWNGNTLDEFLTIELFTQTGLNKMDAVRLPSAPLERFQRPGVRIMHADARAGRGVGSSLTYSDTPSLNGTFDIIAANTISRSNANNPRFKLLQLIQSGGINTLATSKQGVAGDRDLFHEGDEFVADNQFFVDGKFNDGTPIGYKIIIDSLSATSATIRFVKI